MSDQNEIGESSCSTCENLEELLMEERNNTASLEEIVKVSKEVRLECADKLMLALNYLHMDKADEHTIKIISEQVKNLRGE